jgi:hypothetical protein
MSPTLKPFFKKQISSINFNENKSKSDLQCQNEETQRRQAGAACLTMAMTQSNQCELAGHLGISP